jgi:CheY-like chemotaxis protein
MFTQPHVLHVDANQAQRERVAASFSQSNALGILHSLSSASNALLYLNRLGPFRDSPKPRAVLLDIDLPRTNGQHFLDMLRTNTRFKAIETVVLLNADSPDALQRLRAFGITDAVAIPRAASDLEPLIQLWKRLLKDPLPEAPPATPIVQPRS